MNNEVIESYIGGFIPWYVVASGKLVQPRYKPMNIEKIKVPPFPIFNVSAGSKSILFGEDPANDVSVGAYTIFYQVINKE